MKRSYTLITFTAGILSLVFTATAEAELHSRLGGAAAYDDALDITWLTDAGLSGSNSWNGQLAWVASLNSANHLGFNDWRLASMSVSAGLPTGMADTVVDCSTIWPPLCQDNELGYMFYHNLGGSYGEDLTGDRMVGDVALTNIQRIYWSGTESGITNAWMIHFDSGFVVWSPKNGNRYAWAVRPGDVGAGPHIGDGDLAPLNAPDGVVNAADVLVAVRITLDLLAAGDRQLLHGDVYPPGNPDGVINMQDLILITRIVLQ
ncbi:MAG: DUF1566 domain-containing protein [Thiohalobacterales bacterium]|nr:DUF1566 domain-containing protein [Thiohalobacterales bacterium]